MESEPHAGINSLYRKDGTPRFKVSSDGCWNWIMCRHPSGYGMYASSHGASALEQYAHRAVWTEINGPIGAGLTIDHLCRNRGCVNPEHMELVSLAENVRRSPRTKLTENAVKEIRESHRSGSELAAQFGVTRQAIWRVRHQLCWRISDSR